MFGDAEAFQTVDAGDPGAKDAVGKCPASMFRALVITSPAAPLRQMFTSFPFCQIFGFQHFLNIGFQDHGHRKLSTRSIAFW